MDRPFQEEEVTGEQSPLDDGWNEADYLWNPFEMKAKKIHPANPSKPRRRGRARGRSSVVCQVEGCQRDLAGYKDYHHRYKICPMHMKAEAVFKDGRQQRFCQQCGRFHPLNEFDENKRSCRERLKKHNERRRKKANSAPLKRSGSDRSSTVTQSNCPTDSNIGFEFNESVKDVEMDPAAMASSLFSNLEKNPCYTGMTPVTFDKGSSFDGESLRNSGHDRHPTPLGGVCLDMAALAESSRFPQDQGGERLNSLCSEANEFRPFSGAATGAPLDMPLAGSLFSVCPLMEPVAFVPPKSSPARIGYGNHCPLNPSQNVCPWNACPNQESPPARAVDTDSFEWNVLFGAERMSHDECRAVNYKNLLKLTSLSVKIFNCTPGDLPPGLKCQLLHAVQGGLVPEGYMRPGCVHLMFDVFQHGCQKVSTLDDIVSDLLSHDSSFWREHNVMVQTNGASILLSSGEVKKTFCLESDYELYPTVSSVHPVCILNSAPSTCFTVKGEEFHAMENTSIHCRIQGRFIPSAIDHCNAKRGSMSFCIDHELPCGLMKIEVSKNGMIGRCLPVLCVEEHNVVTEIESFHGQQGCDLYDFLMELGLAIELRSWLNSVCLRYGVDTVYLKELFQSVGSFGGRLGFKNATLGELSCCIQSACHVSAYCRQQGLSWTAQYLHPVVSLSVQERIDRPPRLRMAKNCNMRQKRPKRCHKFIQLRFQKHEASKSLTCY